jgi:hypothetical protein
MRPHYPASAIQTLCSYEQAGEQQPFQQLLRTDLKANHEAVEEFLIDRALLHTGQH